MLSYFLPLQLKYPLLSVHVTKLRARLQLVAVRGPGAALTFLIDPTDCLFFSSPPTISGRIIVSDGVPLRLCEPSEF